MRASSTHIRNHGFTLIESALCLCIIGLLMAGMFVLVKNIQDDIIFESAKNDSIQLLSSSRSYLEVMPKPDDPNLFAHIKLPNGFVVLPPGAMIYQTSYAQAISLAKTNYIPTNQNSIEIHLLFYSNKFVMRYCEFFQNHLSEYNLQGVSPADCSDTNNTQVTINAYTSNGD